MFLIITILLSFIDFYLRRGPKWKQFERYSLAADSISIGDIVSAKIRSTNNWSLLPAQVTIFYLTYHQFNFKIVVYINLTTFKINKCLKNIYTF